MKGRLFHFPQYNRPSGWTIFQQLSGPLLTLLALTCVELFRLTDRSPPYPVPIFLLLTVYASLSGGIQAGLASSALTILYNFYYFSEPGTLFQYSDDELQRLIANSIALPVAAFLVGTLKLRADRLAANALLASESRFEATFEQAAVGIGHVALNGRWLRVNQRLCEMLGYSREELLRRTSHDVTYPDDVRLDQNQFKLLLAGKFSTYTEELRYIRADSTQFWISLTVSLVRTTNGDPDYCISVISDISQRKQIEDALRQSETRYRRLFADSPEAMWVYDRQTLRFLEVNDTATSRYGYLRDEFVTMTLGDIVVDEVSSLFDPTIEQLTPPSRHGGRCQHRKRDGTLFWVDTVSHPIELDGRAAALVVAADVTDRLRAEIALAAEKERLAVTLRSIGEGVITTDRQARITLLNKAAEMLTGWSQSEASGMAIDVILSTSDAQSDVPLNNLVARVLQSGQMIQNVRPATLAHRAGTSRIITTSGAPMLDQNGQIIGVVVVFRDITERARLEQQLQQVQRMESIGLLAGGIAHDFNNLMSGIIGTADLALLDVDQTAPIHEDLQNIRKQALRGAALTKQLLAFSRRQVLEPELVDLNGVVHEVEHFIGRAIGRHITLKFLPASDLATVYVDPLQIEQVLLNLCINARDAMPEGGQLLITTMNVKLDETFCREHVGVQPGEYVQLVVVDTGTGMNHETAQHIFEPFFTTKELGKGTGLGLAMAYGIITQHNGLIYVESELGRGSTFTILLPVVSTDEVVERMLGGWQSDNR